MQPLDIDLFINDAPLTDPQLDRFKRLPFAERIAKTLALRRDPTGIVVLIHGRWGEGKTTLLEYVHGSLYKCDNVVPVRFNPWFFSDETTLLLSFFATIATALDRSPKTATEKLGNLFRRYGDVVGEITIEAHGTKLSVGRTVSKLGERLSMVTLEERRDRIAAMLCETGKRVVVFLDDIDRLDRKDAQSVFKLLKLAADLKYVSYVLAFDRNTVAEAIGEQYGSGDASSGHQYLEKVIQVNLDLPVADRESLSQLCIDGVNEALRIAEVTLSPEQEQEFQLPFFQYIVPDLDTPRLAKLYANAVAFVLPLLANEVNAVDVLMLEALKFLYPKIHADIREFPKVYTGEFGLDFEGIGTNRAGASVQHLSKVLDAFSGRKRSRAQHLLTEIFPQLHELFRSQQYGQHSREWSERHQRVSSLDYLSRYLTCSIPTGDVSDQEVEGFIKQIHLWDDNELRGRYCALLRPNEEGKLLMKLNRRAEELPSEPAARLSLAIAKSGSALPAYPNVLAQPIALATLLIRSLLQRVDPLKRRTTALDVLSSAAPLAFAAVCLDGLRPKRPDADGEIPFSAEEMDDLTAALAARISDEARTTSIITDRQEATGRLLSIWQRGGGNSPVKAYVEEMIRANPQASIDFIRPFSSFLRTGAVGIDQAGYDYVLNFIDPEILISAFETASILAPERKDDVALIAQQFRDIFCSKASAQPNTNE